MIVEQAERTIEQTSPQTLTEKLKQSENRLSQVAIKLGECAMIPDEKLSGITRSKYDRSYEQQSMSFVPTKEELEAVPEEVSLLLAELGLTSEDSLDVALTFTGLKPDNKWWGSFSISISPETVSEEKFGVCLPSRGFPSVGAPTKRMFDGIHQYVDSYYGKGADARRTMETLSREATPFYHDLMVSTGEWVHDVIMGRQIPEQTPS